jgi:LacI family repressor for deo operon, udp, cdd, tsx, nupC, and nupG
MITTKDIADRLQLSVSTVGRALSNDSRISAATTQRVHEVAAEMGYVMNRAARMMRGAKSNLVGLVLPDIRNGFYSTIAHALSKCLEKAEFQLTLSETDDDRAIELRHLRELISANVAGVIIVPSAKPHPDSIRLLSMTPHIQLLRRHPALGTQWFGIDDARALEEATRHLVQHGHERIAYIGGSTELPTGAERLRGFRAGLAGTPAAAKALEELGTPSQSNFGRDALRRLLDRRLPPTAIVMGAVRITQDVLEELLARGVRVPDDLSVIGFGDEPGFSWWGPGLTTIGLPVSELATACGLWFLHHHLQNKGEGPVGPYSAMSPASLIVRGSTRAIAPPPRSDNKKSTRRVAAA